MRLFTGRTSEKNDLLRLIFANETEENRVALDQFGTKEDLLSGMRSWQVVHQVAMLASPLIPFKACFQQHEEFRDA